MKIAVISDTHFGIKNDVAYMLDYQEKFYQNFFTELSKRGINQVLHLGDLFDRRKYINFTTLSRAKTMFLDVLEAQGITMNIIPGNHDVVHRNTNNLNSLDQLLGAYKNINIIHNPRTLDFDGVNIALIPWINEENREDVMNFIHATPAKFLGGHLELIGFDFTAGVKAEHGDDPSLFSKFEQVWSGHYHHKSSKGNIHYLGSPMEFTFADYADPKGFHVFDTETSTIEFVKNPFVLHTKFYYNDEQTSNMAEFIKSLDYTDLFGGKIVKLYVTKKTLPTVFEQFVELIEQASPVDLSVMEDYTQLSGEALTDEEVEQSQSTKDLMSLYVDSSDTDMDKTRLKKILSEIYIEAIHETTTI